MQEIPYMNPHTGLAGSAGNSCCIACALPPGLGRSRLSRLCMYVPSKTSTLSKGEADGDAISSGASVLDEEITLPIFCYILALLDRRVG